LSTTHADAGTGFCPWVKADGHKTVYCVTLPD
jgi:hypothetical protein